MLSQQTPRFQVTFEESHKAEGYFKESTRLLKNLTKQDKNETKVIF